MRGYEEAKLRYEEDIESLTAQEKSLQHRIKELSDFRTEKNTEKGEVILQNDEIGRDRDLFVIDQIRALYHQFTVFVIYFSDHTLDIVHAILFNCTTVELIKVLTRCSYIYIEYINICIRILISCKHFVLCSIHTANL